MSGHKKDIIICVADKNKGTDKFDFVSVVKFENNIIEGKCVAGGECGWFKRTPFSLPFCYFPSADVDGDERRAFYC